MSRDLKEWSARAWPVLVLGLSLAIFPGRAPAQPHGHDKIEKNEHPQEQVVLTGQLVDVTWFFNSQTDTEGQDQATRATNRIAAGTPAGLLPEGAGKPEEIWYLVTNSTPLAPYAGKSIKVEGRRLSAIHAIEPAALYVKDGEEWRQVQLRQEGPTGVPPRGAGMKHEHAKQGKPATAQHGETASSKPTEKPNVEYDGAKSGERDHADATSAPGNTHAQHEHDEGGTSGTKHDPGHNEKQDHEHDFGVLLTVPPLHPVLVNFTAGLFPMALLAEFLGRLLRRKSLHAAAWWMLLFAAVITPFTALAGWLWYKQLGDMGHVQMHIHPWLGLSLAILLPTLAIWRGRIYTRDQTPSRAYLVTATVLLLALMVQGHLGATMSFPSAHQSGSHGGGKH